MIFKNFKKVVSFLIRKFFSHKYLPTPIFLLFFNLRYQVFKHRYKIRRISYNSYKLFEVVNKERNLHKYFYFRERGYIFLKNGFKKRGEQIGNDYMLNNIAFSENDLVIDVGANFGDLLFYFENLNIKYFGIEPGKIEYECLKLNVPDGKIFNIALGNENDKLKFFYKPETGDSSLVEMNDFSSSYEVNVITYDDFIFQNNLKNSHVKLLKLEAEGFEPEILSGMKKTIENIEFISADLGPERGKEEEATAPDALNFLFKNNFSLVDYNPIRHVFLLRNNKYDHIS